MQSKLINIINHIFVVVVLVGASLDALSQEDRYGLWAHVYKDCVDGEVSKIYDPQKWPPGFNPPEFPGGGDVELIRFVASNIEYPEVVDSVVTNAQGEEIKYLMRGTVLVQVTVDRCGRAVDPVVVQSVAEEYDKEAIRIMEGLPVFKPASIERVRVKTFLIIPVHFRRKHPKPKREDDYIDYEDFESGGSYDDYIDYDSYY